MAESVAALTEVNGKRFGRLTAVAYSGNLNGVGRGIRRWEFVCDCGNTRAFPLFKVRRGLIRSCGCQEAEEERALFRTADFDPFISQHATYEDATIASRVGVIETGFSRSTINRTQTPIDDWFYFDAEFWSRRQVRVIERARSLWRDVDRPTHPFFEDLEDGDDIHSERAKNLLRRSRHYVGLWRWNIFENVVRWNEPTGVPGSKLFAPSPAAVASAKITVRGVAEDLGEALIL